MNRMKTNNFLLLIVLFLLYISLFSSACRPEDPRFITLPKDSLPAATDTGGNIFACRVNGKVWIARNEVPTPGEYAIQGEYVSKQKLFYVSARKALYGTNFNQTIGVYVAGVTDTGLYKLVKDREIKLFIYQPEPYRNYKTDSLTTGYVKITRLDTINRILSGLFSGSAKNTNGPDTVKISDGRFDFRY